MQVTHKGYEIKTDLDRQHMSNSLGILTTYEVTKPDFFCYFIFGDGLLAMMGNLNASSQDFEEIQLEIIKDRIDSDVLENYEEYIFQYYGSNYLEEENATWWKKTLKEEAKLRGLLK